MIKTIVNRNIWSNCYYNAYKKSDMVASQALQYLYDNYSIAHWQKINFDSYQLTFMDSKKMAYWVLKYQ